MAYANVLEFDVDMETHLRIAEAIGDEPAKGLIVHVAGPIDAGIRSIDVWETKEDFDRFFGERIMPALESLGIPGGPPLRFEELDAPFMLGG